VPSSPLKCLRKTIIAAKYISVYIIKRNENISILFIENKSSTPCFFDGTDG
jgi:hypothetical protein